MASLTPPTPPQALKHLQAPHHPQALHALQGAPTAPEPLRLLQRWVPPVDAAPVRAALAPATGGRGDWLGWLGGLKRRDSQPG